MGLVLIQTETQIPIKNPLWKTMSDNLFFQFPFCFPVFITILHVTSSKKEREFQFPYHH